jgi:hypothetical protein
MNVIPDQAILNTKVLAYQELIAQSRAREAEFDANAAAFRAAEADVDRQVTEQILLRQRNGNRPSMFVGAELTRAENGKWVCSFGALYAEGDSPEQAFDNFDMLWLFGDTPPREPGTDAQGPALVPGGDGPKGGNGGKPA